MRRRVAIGLVAVLSASGGWVLAPRFLDAAAEGEPSVEAPAAPVLRASGRGGGKAAPEKTTTVERMFRALRLAEGAGKGDFARRLKELELAGTPGSAVDAAARSALLREWVEADPAGAFRHALAAPDQRLAVEIALLWLERDSTSALAAVGGMEKGERRDYLLGKCATALIATDMERACAIVESNGLIGMKVPAFLAAVAAKDPDRAFGMVPDSLPEGQRSYLLRSICTEWAKADPAAAAGRLADLPQESGWAVDVWVTVMRGWFAKDPAAAVAFITDPEHPERIDFNHTAFMGEWAAADAAGAEAYARSLPEGQRQKAMAALAHALAKNDGPGALRLALEAGGPGTAQDIAQTWASRDWEGSLAAVLALEPGAARDAALRGFTEGLSSNEVVRSAGIGAWVEPLMGLANQEGSRPLDLSWAYESLGREEILRLGARFGEPFLAAIQNGIGEGARADPAGTAELVGALPAGETRDDLIQSVAAEWARIDTPAAMAWVEAQPEGIVRDTAFRNVVNAALRHDPAGTLAWIDGLPPSSARDAASLEFIGERAPAADGAELVALARGIGNGGARDAALLDALRGWVARDSTAAMEAIGGMELPDAVREQVGSFAESEAWWRAKGSAR